MTNRPSSNRGYAMPMVVLFMVLFLGMWGLAARQIGTMLRIEQARARRVQRDSDLLPVKTALAQAMAVLETGYPPSSPYTCVVAVTGVDFALTFERDAAQPDEWTIQAAPASEEGLPRLDPTNFTETPPPDPRGSVAGRGSGCLAPFVNGERRVDEG